MLEIPEAHVLASQIGKTLQGKKINHVVTNASPHRFAFYFGDPQGYPSLLLGRTIQAARAVAGQVEVEADSVHLLFSDGVNARYYSPGVELPVKHQLMLGFEDGSALICTIQMYGGLWAYPVGSNDNKYYRVALSKPNPLTQPFDEHYFDELARTANPTLSLKAFLATEQRIPGLGNGVLQDILFRARLHPKRKLASLSDSQRAALFASLKTTLAQMTDQGGRDTEKDLFGQSGGYRTLLSSKTLAQPCPVCGGAITRQAYLGGNVYLCVHCQPL